MILYHSQNLCQDIFQISSPFGLPSRTFHLLKSQNPFNILHINWIYIIFYYKGVTPFEKLIYKGRDCLSEINKYIFIWYISYRTFNTSYKSFLFGVTNKRKQKEDIRGVEGYLVIKENIIIFNLNEMFNCNFSLFILTFIYFYWFTKSVILF